MLPRWQRQKGDWIVSDATGDLFVECKTKKLRFGAKIGLASTDILNEDLEKMAGFIVQLYKTLADALKDRYLHWAPRGRPVYPLITTLEEWYAFGDRILAALDEIVGRKFAVEKIDPTLLKAHPYSICAVEDFELAIQVMQQTGIHAFMDNKVTGEHRLFEHVFISWLYVQGRIGRSPGQSISGRLAANSSRAWQISLTTLKSSGRSH